MEIKKFKKKIDPTLIESLPEIIRIEAGYHSGLCIDNQYNLWVFGWNCYGQLGLGDKINRFEPVKHDLKDILDIFYGGTHTFIKTSNNEIYTFGRNSNHQIGIDNSQQSILSPIRVFKGEEHIWGSNRTSRAKSAMK